MTYSVTFKKSAFKDLQAIPARLRQKILDAIQLLALNPYTELLQIKKLKGPDSLYRVRVQDYRILYTIENRELRVQIIKIGHRREVYD